MNGTSSGGRPRVSIVTIFLNAGAFIDEAVQSVIAQTRTDWELLLVDDGSSDHGSGLARAYASRHPERIRYLSHPDHANLGMSASRNLGIRESSAEFIAFLDADDVWMPDKLERHLDALDAHPDASMIYGPSLYWHSWTGENDDRFKDYVCQTGVAPNAVMAPPELLRLALQGTLTPCPSALVVRRDAVVRNGGFEEAFRGLYEDQVFLAKIFLREHVLVSGRCLEKYRIHDQSCDAIATREGAHETGGLIYLRWLADYVERHRLDLPEIDRLIADAIRDTQAAIRSGPSPELVPGEIRRRRWWMAFAAGNSVRLDVLEPDGLSVKLHIERVSQPPVPHGVQLNQDQRTVRGGQDYVVKFRARAEQPRPALVGLALAYPPWSNLGLYEAVELSPEWRAFEIAVVASVDCENARIHFDLGNEAVATEIADVTLIRASDGQVLEPAIPT